MKNKIDTKSIASKKEINNRNRLLELLQQSPIPDNEKLHNTGVFLKRQELSKILFLNDLYRKVLNVQGVVIEFGVRWGQNLVTLMNLRGIYEPYNYGRKLLGFDTFNGFLHVSEKDGNHEIIHNGAFGVSEKYEEILNEILVGHEKEAPLTHIKKFEIIKGDAVIKFEDYLTEHPETIIAFAYFDFDLYLPTKKCLELVLKNMPKGGIICFDELLDQHFPGETLALKEVIDLRKHQVFRNPYGGLQSYIIME
jgi:hypothetical protein